MVGLLSQCIASQTDDHTACSTIGKKSIPAWRLRYFLQDTEDRRAY